MRSGYAALVGRPNVGKSTLLNALAGERVSITTPKPETTRDRILAVVTRGDDQVIFVDTPGLHRPVRKLGEYMVQEARRAAHDADVVVVVVDATVGVQGLSRDAPVVEALAGVDRPVLLAINKIDRLPVKGALLPLIEGYSKLRPFEEIIPLAAATGDGVDLLFEQCARRMPEGELLFPRDALTDRPERYLVAERIREAVIVETAEEVPYVTAVEIESFDEKAPVLHIRAVIHVERPGQKKIMIGTGGERIKAIGIRARRAIESMLGRQVYLELFVKVTPHWTRSPQWLERFGYRFKSEG